MRYFIHLAYDGTNYRGWQRQKSPRNTVQEVVEKTLTQIFKKPMSVYGCGRTDAGVHASQYVLQINVDEAPEFDLKFRLNKNLPHDISVFEIVEVDQDHHCRHDAEVRTYDYFIHWNKDPILYRYSSYYEGVEFDFELMKKAAQIILKTKDFRAVCKQPNSYNNTLCEITNCEVFINEGQQRLRFTISANRFLRGMVRLSVFYLMEIGSGNMTLQEFEEILLQGKDLEERLPAFPNGLFLSKVEYPFLKLKEPHNVVSMLKIGLE